jgi:hypothetical protein
VRLALCGRTGVVLASMLAIGLLVVYGLAAGEKIGLLRDQSAQWHPTLSHRRLLRRFATPIVLAALVGDLATTTLILASLLGAPWKLAQEAAALSLVLLGIYTAGGLFSHTGNDTNCACLGLLLDTRTREGLLVRNLLFAAASAILLTHSTVAPDVGLDTLSGSALLILGTAAAVQLIDRLSLRRNKTLAAAPGEGMP